VRRRVLLAPGLAVSLPAAALIASARREVPLGLAAALGACSFGLALAGTAGARLLSRGEPFARLQFPLRRAALGGAAGVGTRALGPAARGRPRGAGEVVVLVAKDTEALGGEEVQDELGEGRNEHDHPGEALGVRAAGGGGLRGTRAPSHGAASG
jgi:hypothetical protein